MKARTRVIGKMSEEAFWDKEKGRLGILGHRRVAIDAQALCEHLDSLLGSQVAEVIINNHEVRLGKEDAEGIRREKPQATIQEILDQLAEADRLSGMGVVKVTVLPGQVDLTRIAVEISDPCVTRTEGASRAFVCSYWSGVLSALLGGEFEAKNVTCDTDKKVMKCQISRRVDTDQERSEP